MGIEPLGRDGNVVLARPAGRKFPGLLVQGDSLYVLLTEIEEEAPESPAAATVRGWLSAYESMMADAGLELPYFR